MADDDEFGEGCLSGAVGLMRYIQASRPVGCILTQPGTGDLWLVQWWSQDGRCVEIRRLDAANPELRRTDLRIGTWERWRHDVHRTFFVPY